MHAAAIHADAPDNNLPTLEHILIVITVDPISPENAKGAGLGHFGCWQKFTALQFDQLAKSLLSNPLRIRGRVEMQKKILLWCSSMCIVISTHSMHICVSAFLHQIAGG